MPMLVTPIMDVASLCVAEPVMMVVPEHVNDVTAVVACKLAEPNVCVTSPPIVRLLGVPMDVRELLVTVDPNEVEPSARLFPT